MILMLLVLASPFLFGIACLWRRGDSAGRRTVRALGLLGLAALPAGVIQAMQISASVVLTPLIALSFNVAGWSVSALFEELMKGRHRQSTVMDSLGIYLPLAAAQAALLVGLLVWRTRGDRSAVESLKRPSVWVLVLGTLANSLCGSQWPWWGT